MYIFQRLTPFRRPLWKRHMIFKGYAFKNSIFKAFQREVRHLNRFSEVSSAFLSRL